MEIDKCAYLAAAMEEDDGKVDMEKPCLLQSFLKQKGLIAGKGFCERCGKNVTKGTFEGPSVGSLTETNNK